MSVLETLKKHLRGSVSGLVPDATLFPKVDLQHIRDNERINERAAENGAAERPASDTQNPDAVELGIRGLIEQAGNRYVQDFQAQIDSYRQRIAGLVRRVDLHGIDNDMRQFVTDMSAGAQTITNPIYDTHALLKGMRGEVVNFRNDNGLMDRIPVQSDHLRALITLFGFFVVETLITFYLLDEDRHATVIWLAIIYCGINLGITYFLAMYARYVNHKNKKLKVFGWSIVLLIFVIAFVVNFLIGNYRAVVLAMRTVPAEQFDLANLGALVQYADFSRRAMVNFLQSPFELLDALAWLLTIVGFGCCAYAFKEGYESDDKYPGYGAQFRRWNDHFDAYVEEVEDGIWALQDKRAKGVADIEELKEELTALFEEIPTLIGRAQSSRENCGLAIRLLNTHLNQLIQEYRDANLIARTTNEPEYFQRGSSIDIDVPQLPDFEEVQVQQEINDTLKRFADRLHDNFEDLIKELETTRETLLDQHPFNVTITDNGLS